MEQGTKEWFDARCGIVTSSMFQAVMASGKGTAESKTRETYLKTLACERITGVVQDTFKSSWMQRGNEVEAQARAMFELNNGLDVQQVGFIKKDDDIGASTDGLTEDAVVEIKCPKHTTHLDYLLDSKKLYTTYKQQVQGEIWVAEKSHAYLMSFHPDFPEGKNLIVLDVKRNDTYINEIEEKCLAFVYDLKKLVNQISGI